MWILRFLPWLEAEVVEVPIDRNIEAEGEVEEDQVQPSSPWEIEQKNLQVQAGLRLHFA
jgi:hypothetical protein